MYTHQSKKQCLTKAHLFMKRCSSCFPLDSGSSVPVKAASFRNKVQTLQYVTLPPTPPTSVKISVSVYVSCPLYFGNGLTSKLFVMSQMVFVGPSLNIKFSLSEGKMTLYPAVKVKTVSAHTSQFTVNLKHPAGGTRKKQI